MNKNNKKVGTILQILPDSIEINYYMWNILIKNRTNLWNIIG